MLEKCTPRSVEGRRVSGVPTARGRLFLIIAMKCNMKIVQYRFFKIAGLISIFLWSPLLLAVASAPASLPVQDEAAPRLPSSQMTSRYVGINSWFGRWKEGVVPWSYHPGSTASDRAPALFQDSSVFVELIQSVMEKWSAVSGVTFEYKGGITTKADDYSDGVAVISWSDALGNAAGHAGPYTDNQDSVEGYPHYTDGNLQLNLEADWSEAGNDIEQVLLHELGHLLGLGHSDNPRSILFANPYNYLQELREDDVQAVTALYGYGKNSADTPVAAVPVTSDPAIIDERILRGSNWEEVITTLEAVTSSDTIYFGWEYRAGDIPVNKSFTIRLYDPEGYLVQSAPQTIECNANHSCKFWSSLYSVDQFRLIPGEWRIDLEHNGQPISRMALPVKEGYFWNQSPAGSLVLDQPIGFIPLQLEATLNATDSEQDWIYSNWYSPATSSTLMNSQSNGTLQQRKLLTFNSAGDHRLFVALDDLQSYSTPVTDPESAAGYRQVIRQEVVALPALVPHGSTEGVWNSSDDIPSSISSGIQGGSCIATAIRFYCMGGADGTNPDGENIPATDQVWSGGWGGDGEIDREGWRTEHALPVRVTGLHCLARGETFYCFGGHLSSGYYSDKVYRATLDGEGKLSTWSEAFALPAPMNRLQCLTTDTQLYCLGGKGFLDGGYRSSEKVWMTTWQAGGGISPWSEATPLPAALDHHQCTLLNQRIYCMGGGERISDTAIDTKSEVWSAFIDPETAAIGSWQTEPELPEGKMSPECIGAEQWMYCVGGIDANNLVTDDLFVATLSQGKITHWDTATQITDADTMRQCFRRPQQERLWCIGGYFHKNKISSIEVDILPHPNRADLSLQQSGVIQGEASTTVEIEVYNAGPDLSERSELFYRLSDYMRIKALPEECNTNTTGAVIRCALGTVSANERASVNFVLFDTGDGSQTAGYGHAAVTAQVYDTLPDNNLITLSSNGQDSDGDGVADIDDAFPLDSSETLDSDGDGVGNRADVDDDGDGVEDTHDAFPLDASETVDTDSDSIGNNSDPDDDGDGVSDQDDAFPLDKDRWRLDRICELMELNRDLSLQQQYILYPGWNLIGVPVQSTDLLDQLLQQSSVQGGELESIWHYIGSGKWDYYLADAIQTSTLGKLEAGKGYWVKLSSASPAVQLLLEGEYAEQSAPVVDGWNLLSPVVTTNEYKIPDWMNDLGSSSIWGWQSEERYWLSSIRGVPEFLNSLQQLEFSSGYYHYITTSTETVQCSMPTTVDEVQ